MATIHVIGDELVALAASLRLARLGHRVVLAADSPRWDADSARPLRDELGPTLTLPSAWRDLFAKSGRSMAAELAVRGLRLEPEPDLLVCGGDVDLRLPTDRGAQIRAVRDALGDPAANDWRTTLDLADLVWQARRRNGVERPVTRRPDPLPDPRLPDLPQPLRDEARDLTRLAVTRVFGCWNLVGPNGPTDLQPLLDLLAARLSRRGVELSDDPHGTSDAAIDTRSPSAPRPSLHQWPSLRRWQRSRPWQSPTITKWVDRAVGPGQVEHTVRWTDRGAVETWRWSDGHLTTTLRHDHVQPVPDPSLGTEWSAWRDRPPMRWQDRDGVPTLSASAASHGGPEPWARLLTGALAAYSTHELLTGEDVRPTNRAIGAAGRPRRVHGSPPAGSARKMGRQPRDG